MSRHGRCVPTSFYRRFAREALSLAQEYAQGRLISVLEGGYSDRALTSGVMSWLAGMAEGPMSADTKPVKQEIQNPLSPDAVSIKQETEISSPAIHVDDRWWSVDNLEAVRAVLSFPACDAH